jgi:hypothetical protein
MSCVDGVDAYPNGVPFEGTTFPETDRLLVGRHPPLERTATMNRYALTLTIALIALTAATETPTPPDALRVDFGEVVTLLDQAEERAPAAISDDIAASNE